MPLGPVELLIVQFPGSEVKGDIAPAIKELVENGTIRVIDILFIKKDQDGNVTMREINDLDDASFAAFNRRGNRRFSIQGRRPATGGHAE